MTNQTEWNTQPNHYGPAADPGPAAPSGAPNGPNRVGIVAAIVAVLLLTAVGSFVLLRADGPRSGAADTGAVTNTSEGADQADELDPESPSTDAPASSTTRLAAGPSSTTRSAEPATPTSSASPARRATASTGATTATTRTTASTTASTTPSTEGATTTEADDVTSLVTTAPVRTSGISLTVVTGVTIPTSRFTIPTTRGTVVITGFPTTRVTVPRSSFPIITG